MVGKQAQAFLSGEGDSWFERNKDNPRDNDLVLRAIDRLEIVPSRVLEVGCGTGWRLERLTERYHCHCIGIDPSEKALGVDSMWQAVDKGKVRLMRGTAATPYPTGNDLIIFGFCLYLVDREDLFKVVYEADRALNDGGYIIIHDFHSPYQFARVYEHFPDLLSYHMDYPKLWLGHPHYHIALQHLYAPWGGDEAITVLKKNVGGAFPLE